MSGSRRTSWPVSRRTSRPSQPLSTFAESCAGLHCGAGAVLTVSLRFAKSCALDVPFDLAQLTRLIRGRRGRCVGRPMSSQNVSSVTASRKTVPVAPVSTAAENGPPDGTWVPERRAGVRPTCRRARAEPEQRRPTENDLASRYVTGTPPFRPQRSHIGSTTSAISRCPDSAALSISGPSCADSTRARRGSDSFSLSFSA